MRRIYESDALTRDDDDPFAPDERETTRPRAARSLPVERLVRTLTTAGLRRRGIQIRLDAPDTAPVGERVPFVVELHNPLPVPVSVETVSPLRWWWAVDGHREAAHDPEEPPREPHRLVFDRAERKRFTRGWNGQFRVSETEWEPAGRGEHTLSAGINVDDPAAGGLTAETTVRLE
ncbi:MAG: hypothetical protein J07HB67_01193 [halophilic archaeon J07HB67]|jgi:hypothetical protein|nr:MAG: hypothetical protein J07HB67_01193 [halophilic archaeon J07HB67]